jgi:hypothetical protein
MFASHLTADNVANGMTAYPLAGACTQSAHRRTLMPRIKRDGPAGAAKLPAPADCAKRPDLSYHPTRPSAI